MGSRRDELNVFAALAVADQLLTCSIILTKSATVFARIFRMALARCSFTVTSLTPRSAAICLFRSPAATLAITSRSRELSDSKFFRKVECDSSPFAASPVLFQGRENRVQQVRPTERLGQKVDRPCFHRAHGHGNVSMAGNENDRYVNPRSRQFLLNFEATPLGQPHIEHQATRSVWEVILQEGLPDA